MRKNRRGWLLRRDRGHRGAENFERSSSGISEVRMQKRATHHRRKEIYAELCLVDDDHQANWIEAKTLARDGVKKAAPISEG